MKLIRVELYDVNGRPFHYDAFQDGPLNEWLINVVPQLGKHFNATLQNATVTVYDYDK